LAATRAIVRFSSLGEVLANIQQQPGWEQYQQYCQLLQCWPKTVTEDTARFAHPLYIKQEVLWVAAANSARAQELTFQRYSLLKKLNSQLSFSLKDIRFSPSGWKNKLESTQNRDAVATIAKNDRTYEPKERSLVESKAIDSQGLIEAIQQDPQAIVRRWIELAKTKDRQWQSCPECGASTPEIELKRWNLCHHCIAKKWSTKYRPPSS
jgi:predicted nucleic acid-binding Zn ribbon protein